MKPKSLRQLDEDWQRLSDALEETGGELTPEMEEEFAELLHAHGDKVEGYIALIIEAQAEADMFKAEEKRLNALRKTAENKASNLKARLLFSMEQRGDAEYVTPIGKAKVTKNGGKQRLTLAVEPEQLPEHFRTVTVTYSADEEALRHALDEGSQAAHAVASLEPRGTHLRIR